MLLQNIKEMPRKRLLFGTIMLAVFLTIVWMPPKILFLNFSDSVPRGLYLRIPLGTVQAGDMVAYMPTDDVVCFMLEANWLKENDPSRPFLKYVGGLPGDTYAVKDRIFLINGDYIGDVLDTDSKGYPLPKLSGSFYVPECEFLPLSSDAFGFDGRYTGCVPTDRIIAKVIFLFGW